MSPGRFALGVVAPSLPAELVPKMDALARFTREAAGFDFEPRPAASYEALASDVRDGRVDLAWLPPIVYVRLADEVVPIGSVLRGGRPTYEAALVVRSDSEIRSLTHLRGTRAGWVDRWSAAGFVLPRVKLALVGVDPRTLFRTETFHGSHRAAIRALIEGACDVIGTYARADGHGHVVAAGGGELGADQVRVLATFGAIPPDVIAARRDAAEDLVPRARAALRSAATGEAWTFAGRELREGVTANYESLKGALDMARARGLFD